MTTLYVVTLYPYDDGSEARYQFDDLEKAEAFATKVNGLPVQTLRYVTGSGRPEPVKVWLSGTYESTDAAWEELQRWVPECEHDNVLAAMDRDDPGAESTSQGVCSDCGAHVHLEPTEDGDRRWETD